MIKFADYLKLVTSAAKDCRSTDGAEVEELTRLFEEKRAQQEKKKADYQAAHPPNRSTAGATTVGTTAGSTGGSVDPAYELVA